MSLKEALDRLQRTKAPNVYRPDIEPVIAAARAVDEGTPIWYCEPHQQTNWNDHACWVYDMGPDPCRMVPARLLIGWEE